MQVREIILAFLLCVCVYLCVIADSYFASFATSDNLIDELSSTISPSEGSKNQTCFSLYLTHRLSTKSDDIDKKTIELKPQYWHCYLWAASDLHVDVYNRGSIYRRFQEDKPPSIWMALLHHLKGIILPSTYFLFPNSTASKGRRDPMLNA